MAACTHNGRFGRHEFHFHDIRAKSASDAPTEAQAQDMLGHIDARTTRIVYRRKPIEVIPLKAGKQEAVVVRRFAWNLSVTWQTRSFCQNGPRGNSLKGLVGAARFELATTCTPCRYATRLRYAPTRGKSISADEGIRLAFNAAAR